MYYDGANLLIAIMGKVRPGDLGFDIVHLNLHKSFSTPHGEAEAPEPDLLELKTFCRIFCRHPE